MRKNEARKEAIIESSGNVFSDLTRGKTEKFSLDMLVTFAARLGKPARIELSP